MPILLIILAASAISLHAAEQSGKKAFVSAWEDRTVVLKQTLYSIVFDERTRFVPIVKRQGRVSGLTVATSSGMFPTLFARCAPGVRGVPPRSADARRQR